MKHRILPIGDLHLPYHNRAAVRQVIKLIKKLRPTHIIQVGDLYDQYCFSRFTKKNITTSIKEILLARKYAVELWTAIRKVAPRAKCFQLLGNHDVRLTKRIAEKVPEAYEIVKEKLDELYTFRGVKTLYDERDILKIGSVAFTHGYLSRLGDHCRLFGQSVVVGHSHVGGCVFEQRHGKIIYELNAGYLADESSEPLRYRPTKTCKWTLGVGYIDSNGPRFIPFRKK